MDIKQQVQSQFGQNAGKYVTSSLHAKGKDLDAMVRVAEIGDDTRLLDIATGGGHVANVFAPLVKHLTAYDLTAEILAAAKSFVEANGHTHVKFEIGDAESLPFTDDTFDIVTCRIAAHHFPDVASFVRESERVLSAGGQFILVDNVAPESDALDTFYNTVEKRRDPSHYRAWKKSEWVKRVEEAGLAVELVMVFPKTFIYEDWCARMDLNPADKNALEQYMLSAPEEARRHFCIAVENGRLASFRGEAILLKARKKF